MCRAPRLASLLFVAGFLPTPAAIAKSALDCIDPEDAVGVACESPASLRVQLRNLCADAVFVNLCIQVDGEEWDCWRADPLAPGEALTGESCWSTRRYEFAACTGGVSECGFSP